MAKHSDSVDYKWTDRDQTAAQKAAGGAPFDKTDVYRYVTPYGILPLAPPGAASLAKGAPVKIALGDSMEEWRVNRFFKSGFSWQEAPGDIGGKTLEELSQNLFARDPVLYAAHDLGKSAAQNKSDFCLLHFDYWQNTDYRFSVTELEAADADPVLGSGFDWTLLASTAHTLPAEAKGTRIKWVLVKTPPPVPPIKVPPVVKPIPDKPAPTPPEDHESTIVVLTRPEIALDSWFSQTLEPMKIDGTGFGGSRLQFKVTLAGPCVKTTLQIRRNGDVHYEETFDKGPFIEKGSFVWEWDGYDSDGKLDTADLKRNNFSARVTIIDKAGRTTFGSVALKISPDGMKWVDVVVKRPEKAFEVTVYGTYVNMSDVPALPIIGPGMIPVFVKPPATMFLDPAIFVDYRRDIIEGIGKFWSRDALALAGDDWSVKTTCVERATNAVPTILGRALDIAELNAWKLESPTIGGWAKANGVGRRSFNLATLREGLPVVDLYIPTEPVVERQYTGAHELGHSVLRERGGVEFSMTHKGSSTIGQVPTPGIRYPAAPAEVDVMMYFDEPSTPLPYDRVLAAKEDVFALISLAKVKVT
jgi:hypothetical protein